ncbi:hypothetical protein [Streptomyces sp. NPDC050535]|uniref:hypothetical protein n=1 Tax=Streptomyces sp. NPDC050535 TaxID=3365626 RepID=UPI0037975659
MLARERAGLQVRLRIAYGFRAAVYLRDVDVQASIGDGAQLVAEDVGGQVRGGAAVRGQPYHVRDE